MLISMRRLPTPLISQPARTHGAGRSQPTPSTLHMWRRDPTSQMPHPYYAVHGGGREPPGRDPWVAKHAVPLSPLGPRRRHAIAAGDVPALVQASTGWTTTTRLPGSRRARHKQTLGLPLSHHDYGRVDPRDRECRSGRAAAVPRRCRRTDPPVIRAAWADCGCCRTTAATCPSLAPARRSPIAGGTDRCADSPACVGLAAPVRRAR